LDEEKAELCNATNGSIENFNNHYGKLFPRHHPSLLEWVDTTLREGQRWCAVLKNQMDSNTFFKMYPTADIKTVPKSYNSFKPPVKKRAYNVKRLPEPGRQRLTRLCPIYEISSKYDGDAVNVCDGQL